MEVVRADLISGKKVLLRLDIDVPIKDGRVIEDFRLKAGLPTLKLCLENATDVIILGHIGRPEGREVPELSVEPIYDWLFEDGFHSELENGKLKLLENLRFESGEDDCSEEYAKQLASYGDFYVNEAFAAHHKAASTTVLPTLLPRAAGLRFAEEVRAIRAIRENPKRPLIALVGGVKLEDKYPAIVSLSNICDKVLVGGLLSKKIQEQGLEKPGNVVLGQLNDEGIDMAVVSLGAFSHIIQSSGQVIWVGPVGKYEDPNGNHGNRELAQAIINSGAETIIGGGDTIAALDEFLERFSFVSVGGGAMLEYLAKGTLSTIEALK